MNYIVCDFESYYASKLGYTLKKMTPVEYILDPRFEAIMCSFCEGDDGAAYWVDGPDLRAHFRELRRRQRDEGFKIIMLSHNALFDMCLLVWRFGLVPDLMIDTMAMSRALLQPKLGYVSLAKVSAYLGIGSKGDTVVRVDGMTRQMIIDAGLWDKYVAYCLNDTILCREVFKLLRKEFPRDEYLTGDMVVRCAAKPKFKLNQDVLYEHLANVKAAKAELLARTGLIADENGKCKELMSNDKFARLLEQFGVEPPTKISPTTGEITYAFAKSDQGMADLEEHDDPDVQALVAARLGFKSTLEETRTERYISISNLQWPHDPAGGRWMPMPLRYSGAHTHRFSGDWSLNVQNMPRGGKLRDSLEAPPGYVVVVCDASQIEARLAAWVAAIVMGEYSELVTLFEKGADVYSEFATKHIYKRLITKLDVKERFVGKQAILGLGFGMGYIRYMVQVRKDSRLQLKIEIILTEPEAKEIVNGYRHGMAPAVPKAWKVLTHQLPNLASCNSGFQFGPVTFGHQEITGPTGLKMYYPNLRQEIVTPGSNYERQQTEWRFKSGRIDNKKLFGGKLYENIIQHLARCCNIETAHKVYKHYGIELALQAHDELVYLVPGGIEFEQLPNGKVKRHPTGFAKDFMQGLHYFMSQRPAWGPTLPLAAEAGVGYTYGDAK